MGPPKEFVSSLIEHWSLIDYDSSSSSILHH